MPTRHQAKTLKSAEDVVRILAKDNYVPEVALFIGTGDASEVPVLQKAWPNCKMLGFDAHKRMAEQANNILPTEHVAIVENTYVKEATLYERASLASASSLWPKPGSRSNHATTVRAMTIDKIACNHNLFGRRVFLWLDCEGSELNAFKGGLSLVKENRWLHLEVWPEPDRPGWPPADVVDKWLKDQGYGEPICHGLRINRHLSHDRTYRKV